ncbi:MAG: CPBP family intramembrane glutamic endopeptidase [Chloroflexota bacterium]
MNRAPATAVLPLILLIAAAAFEWLRPPVTVLLLVGLLATALVARRTPGRPVGRELLVHAGCFVVALNLAWGAVPLEALIGGGAACADRMAPFALLRVGGAVLVLACVGLVVRLARAGLADIGVRWPSGRTIVISLAVVPVIGVAAVLVGPPLAEPFFGPIAPPTATLASLIPALLFAGANATMEEVVYRGALLRWFMPVTGVASALALQAFVFGLAHGVGTDFIGSPLPVMAATVAAGLAFGALALRTRSLLLPIAIHVALDIPVFYGKVCLGA